MPTIAISDESKSKLDSLKYHKREPYYEVLNRALGISVPVPVVSSIPKPEGGV